MIRITFLLCLTTFLFAGYAAFADAQPSPGSEYADLKIIQEYEQAHSGDTFLAGIYIDLADGWHTYWMNPGDSGIPVRISWESVPQGFDVGKTEWPYPYTFQEGHLTTFGYKDETLLMVPVSVDADVEPGTYELEARVDFLVCRESCIPGFETLTHQVEIIEAGSVTSPADEALFNRFKARVPVPASGINSTLNANGNQVELIISGETAGWGKVEELKFFASEENLIESSAGQEVTVEDNQIRILLEKSRYNSGEITELPGILVIPDGDRTQAFEIHAVSN